MGYRRIELNAKHGGEPVFELSLHYKEIEFIFEEKGKWHDGPETLSVPRNFANTILESNDPNANMIQYGLDNQTVRYRPNWVKTFIIPKMPLCAIDDQIKQCKDKTAVGIRVEIQALDLDFDRGDYLLVGPGDPNAGETVQMWRYAKSQIFTRKIEFADEIRNPHRIWINADSAFIR